MRFRIFKNVTSNRVWFIKDGYYYDYIRIIGFIFYSDGNPYIAAEN